MGYKEQIRSKRAIVSGIKHSGGGQYLRVQRPVVYWLFIEDIDGNILMSDEEMAYAELTGLENL